MTALILPDPIAAYFAADKQSADAIAAASRRKPW